jgi:hypothetical protein
MSEYFSREINLDKIPEMSQYLIEKGFEAKYVERIGFGSSFNPNTWNNSKTGLYLHMHNEKSNIFLRTHGRKKEKIESQKEIIKGIMKIVEIEEVGIGSGKNKITLD